MQQALLEVFPVFDFLIVLFVPFGGGDPARLGVVLVCRLEQLLVCPQHRLLLRVAVVYREEVVVRTGRDKPAINK